ncbi:replicative DNA helicase [Niallia sp. Krafla_26]|uniref:replicative DNA helicase n=1 Tax=Niallia sp. Krafla_26 TaxID=3064703 RepID=UPI003D170F16
MEVNDLTAGYHERMSRVTLFEPLYALERKNQNDLDGKNIDMKGLGLLTLLFFFEQKLMRNQKSGVKELAQFLQKVTEEQYRLESNGYEDVARSIIQIFRPPTGKKRETHFFNWETKQEEKIYFSILKANSFDVKTNTQFYSLDEDGLELVFATKEFYSEFQLSINQLVLRKQLEKGEFKGALRQINEMRIDVETLEERIVKLEHEIKRNIISEDTYDRYQNLLEDIFYRLHIENMEFTELHDFVKETKELLYYQDTTVKERQTYELVLEISKELEEVHSEHTKLLQKSIHLKNSALQAARESLYYVGIDTFNFDQDITSRIISSPLPLEAMKGILVPFLHVQETKQWSPLTIFAPQNIKEEKESSNDEGFMEVSEKETQKYQEVVASIYDHYMELLLKAMDDQDSITLRGFFSYLKENQYEEVIHERFVYDFFILLHHRSPLKKMAGDEKDTQVLDKAVYHLQNKVLTVTEKDGLINESKRYSIQDMILTIGDDNNAL